MISLINFSRAKVKRKTCASKKIPLHIIFLWIKKSIGNKSVTLGVLILSMLLGLTESKNKNNAHWKYFRCTLCFGILRKGEVLLILFKEYIFISNITGKMNKLYWLGFLIFAEGGGYYILIGGPTQTFWRKTLISTLRTVF